MSLNLTAAIMLVNKAVRPVRVEYDPDNKYNNVGAMAQRFKTFDNTIQKGSFVIVPTSTRHGMTVAKVTEVDFQIDFNSSERWDWIIGKVDKEGYDALLAQEAQVIKRVGQAEENKMRKELQDALGLGDVDFNDVQIMAPQTNSALPAPPHAPAAPPVQPTTAAEAAASISPAQPTQ